MANTVSMWRSWRVEQYDLVVDYYQGILRETYNNHESRKADLDHLRPVIGRYRSLDSLLADLTLDPIERASGKPDPALWRRISPP